MAGRSLRPFPRRTKTCDRTIDVLSSAVNRAKVADSEKVGALKRRAQFEKEGASSSSPV
ncbi:MAG: hypothetical protein ABI592_00855 [Acidobacteriota bacterium]